MGWRGVKDTMRRHVHRTMRLRAYLYRGDDAPAIVWVRLHRLKDTAHGDLVGTSFNYAVRQDQNPVIVSVTSEYDPQNLDVLSFESGEAFRVDNVMLPEGITTSAEVLALSLEEAADFPPPSEGECA
jgi:hypothetical protein